MKKRVVLALILLSCFSCGTANDISGCSSFDMSQENISSELDSQTNSDSKGKEISIIHISKGGTSSEETSVEKNSSEEQNQLSSEEITNNSQNSNFSEESIKNEEISSIADIKNKAQGFEKLVNNVGVYESSIYVDINLKLIACLDSITSKTGYGDRYKLLMSDGNDYIYIKTKEFYYGKKEQKQK